MLTATATPVAYIRRSIARKGDLGDISKEFQTDKVRALAKDDGPSLRILDGDWGRSAAGEKTAKREEFLDLLEAIEHGEVTTLYAYSADRLARSVRWSAQLLDTCGTAGTTIVTGEGRFAPGDPGARLLFHVLAAMNENALEGMVTKNTAVAGKRKERGDAMGRAPYGWVHELQTDEHGTRRSVLIPRDGEDPQAVVAAFAVAGTYNGAAMLLNGPAGVPQTYDDGSLIGLGVGLATRFRNKDGSPKAWDASTVRHVVIREAPDLAPVRPHKGSPARKSAHMFVRLLRCPHYLLHPDRPYLTVSAAPKYENKAGETHTYPASYYCADAHSKSREVHPRPYMISEAKVLAWAKEETKDISRRVERERKGKSPDPETKLAEMEARKAGIGDAYVAGAYGPAGSPQAKAAMAQRLAAIDAEMPVLEAGRRAMAVGLQPVSMSNLPPPGRPFDWTRDPAAINADLRNLWQRVELDPATMLPVRAVWTIGKDPVEDAAIEAAEAAEYEPQGDTARARIADAVRWYRATEPARQARQAELERLRAQLRSEGKIE